MTEAAEAAILPGQNTRERYWFAANSRRVDRLHLQRQLWKRIYSPLLSFAGLGFGLSGLGLLHTAKRYLWDRASAFLPGELFAGARDEQRFLRRHNGSVDPRPVDNTYKELADAKIVTHPDDPSPGWTFLRKLVQLPMRLPRTTASDVDQVLLAQLGPVHHDEPAGAVTDQYKKAGFGGGHEPAAHRAAGRAGDHRRRTAS